VDAVDWVDEVWAKAVAVENKARPIASGWHGIACFIVCPFDIRFFGLKIADQIAGRL
jgi:hypothetical protein